MIRHATREDACRIAEIHVSSWQSAYRGIVPDSLLDAMDPARRVAMWESFSGDPAAPLFVSTDTRDNRITGFCHIGRARDPGLESRNAAEIYAIYLDPAERRKGHGRALASTALAFARERDFSSVILWVLSANHPGRRFYEAMAFTTDGAEKRESIGGHVLEEIRYRLTLGP